MNPCGFPMLFHSANIHTTLSSEPAMVIEKYDLNSTSLFLARFHRIPLSTIQACMSSYLKFSATPPIRISTIVALRTMHKHVLLPAVKRRGFLLSLMCVRCTNRRQSCLSGPPFRLNPLLFRLLPFDAGFRSDHLSAAPILLVPCVRTHLASIAGPLC